MRAKRWRWPLATCALLLLWLLAGNSVVERLGVALLKPDSLPVDLNAGGHLYYTQGFEGLWRHDLRSGLTEQWWLPAEGSLVSDVAVSPDGGQLALAWAPPAETGFQTGNTDLWLMSLPAGDSRPLLLRSDPLESWRDPFWSPDGNWLLVTHQRVQRDDAGAVGTVIHNLVKVSPDGARFTLVRNAEQGALTSDGAQLVYLRPDPDTWSHGLVLANADGNQARELVDSEAFRALASPRFTPDDRAVVFSASGEHQEAPPDNPADAGTVQAHGEPWNIWQLDPTTGVLTRLTPYSLDGPALAWSPDGSGLLGVLAAEGLFVVGPGNMWRLTAVATEGKLTWAPAS